MVIVVALLALVSAVQFALLYGLRRRLTSIDRVNVRVSRLVESISLLCDTTEAGFGFVSNQLTPKVPARRAKARLARKAVNDGPLCS